MKAISNSSILIALSNIKQLDLLHQRFPDGVLLPPAVWQEVVIAGSSRAGVELITKATWLSIVPVTNLALVSSLRTELDNGEAEAISLFTENPVSAILLDEKNARRLARRMGLPILGTVGILIWAKQNGLITNLKDQLDAIQTIGKFRLSQSVYQDALNQVGE